MRTLALAALLLLAACGKPLLFVEVEIPKAAVLVPQQAFPGTQNPLPTDFCTPDPEFPTAPGNTCLEQDATFDLGSDLTDLIDRAYSTELRLDRLGLALVASDPLTDLGSVYRVRLLIIEENGTPEGQVGPELARYVRDPAAPPSRSIEVTTRSSVNLSPYVRSGKLRFRSQLEFDQVIPGFTADVTGEFYLKVVVDWGKEAGL
jgi:hypothetical protein